MILIIDSDTQSCQSLEHFVQTELGYRTTSVTSGTEMNAWLSEHDVELVLLNLNIPENKGPYLLQQLRKSHTLLDLPIVTLVKNPREISFALEAGANDCISLPMKGAVAKARLRNALSMRQLYKACLTPDTVTISSAAIASQLSFDTEEFLTNPTNGSVAHTVERIYQEESYEEQSIPCEFPMMLIIDNRSFFSKTIWISKQSMLVLAFESLPKESNYQLQVMNPKGDLMAISVSEVFRENAGAHEAGVFKLQLKITNAPREYDLLYLRMKQAFHVHGLSGIQAVWRGEELPDNPTKKLPKPVPGSQILSVSGGLRYRFQRFLGKGGFASVYLVEDLSLKRSVAMKALNYKYAKISDACNNFLSEAQIAAQFHHPNIIYVFEVGEILAEDYGKYLEFPKEILEHHPERMIYFTMQFIEGQTLGQRLRSSLQWDKEEFVNICIGISKAMVYAHNKGVIHRDIKPDNIIITEDLHVLVADFGIAKYYKGGDEEKEAMISCTPEYASPEQICGLKLDHRSDIYSFGVLAYELLCGSPPFRSKKITEMVQLHTNVEPASLRDTNPNVDPGLERIVMRCLAKKPSKRHQSAGEIYQKLLELKGDTRKSTRKTTKEEVLRELTLDASSIQDPEHGGEVLKRIISYLHLHKTYDDVNYIKEIKRQLTQPAFFQDLVSKTLVKANQNLLFDFFKNLESSNVVFRLLMMFKEEGILWKKLALAEFAVISSGRNLFPLVMFGLDLPDVEATILLEAFKDMAYHNQEPIFLKWAEHPGEKTQTQLLTMLYSLNRSEAETMEILKWYSSGMGTRNESVRRRAGQMLADY